MSRTDDQLIEIRDDEEVPHIIVSGVHLNDHNITIIDSNGENINNLNVLYLVNGRYSMDADGYYTDYLHPSYFIVMDKTLEGAVLKFKTKEEVLKYYKKNSIDRIMFYQKWFEKWFKQFMEEVRTKKLDFASKLREALTYEY